MKELQAQYDGKSYTPYTLDDKDKSKSFKVNQIVTLKISGTEKERSMPQLARYWVLCSKASILLSDHTEQFSREDTDFKLKARIIKKHPEFMKRFEVIGNKVIIEPISIAFRNLKHLIANRYFDYADRELELMCKCDIDDLINTEG